VRTNGPITRQLIGEISGLSKPTVNEALDILNKEKLISMNEAKNKSAAGRPGPKAQQITFNKDRKKIVAIDIGGSNIRLLVSDLDGNIIATLMQSTPLKGGRKAIIAKVKELYESESKIEITSFHRDGDVIHAIGDISETFKDLNWSHKYSLDYGLNKIVEWVKNK
jgi:nucleoside-diphosphate-sugar epimerase